MDPEVSYYQAPYPERSSHIIYILKCNFINLSLSFVSTVKPLFLLLCWQICSVNRLKRFHQKCLQVLTVSSTTPSTAWGPRMQPLPPLLPRLVLGKNVCLLKGRITFVLRCSKKAPNSFLHKGKSFCRTNWHWGWHSLKITGTSGFSEKVKTAKTGPNLHT